MDHSSRRSPLIAVLALLVAGTALAAPATTVYDLVLPDGRPVTYELELAVEHPGEMAVTAEWPGTRVVAFRLERPGEGGAALRRSGPSPQSLTHVFTASDLAVGTWTLRINALPARGRAEGQLVVSLPGPPEPAAPADPRADEPPADALPEWARAVPAPSGAPAGTVALFRRAETIIDLVSGDEARPDSCRWQQDFGRWLAAERDALASGGDPLSKTTRKLVERIIEVVRDIEQLRLSGDRMLAGPPPDDPVRRQAWVRTRQARLAPLEHRLDETLHRLRGGHAPELELETWPARYLICATACERFFEQRGRRGDEGAVNRDLADEQWARILAAADALEALIRAPSWSPRARSVATSRHSGAEVGGGLE